MQRSESTTSSYDLYVYSPTNQVVVRWEKIEAPDDDSAAKTAKSVTTDVPSELWQDERLVVRWTD